jgi:hypothetical protein
MTEKEKEALIREWSSNYENLMKDKYVKGFIDYWLKEKQFTPFQADLLNSIYYFETNKGEYRYYKTSLENKFKDFLRPKDITKDINDLIQRELIIKESKKILYNGRFCTVTTFTLNMSLEEKLTDYKKIIKEN